MRAFASLLVLLGASTAMVAAIQSPHAKAAKRSVPQPLYTKDAPRKKDTTLFLNSNSKSEVPPCTKSMLPTDNGVGFAVNGSALPEVDFNIGESYAGLLPISPDPHDPNQLFFWFFPSENPLARKEITICMYSSGAAMSRDLSTQP
jgi:carboxypeptidase D